MCLFADYFISSQADWGYLFPFNSGVELDICKGLVHAQLVFLQHGIIKDDLSGFFNIIRRNIKMFICAVKREYEFILNNKDFGFTEDILRLTGLTRFDNLYNCEHGKDIVYMPTWNRNVLVGGSRVKNENFIKSDYFSEINSVLSNEKLLNEIENSGYVLAFRPHPEVLHHIEDIAFDKRVKVIGTDTSYQAMYANAAMIITDYSSAIFDYAYLKKPILYYQFRKNHYEEGYFDYMTDGFGEVTNDLDELVDLAINHIRTGCKMSDKYLKRVDAFFAFNDRNNCERVYNEIIAKGV